MKKIFLSLILPLPLLSLSTQANAQNMYEENQFSTGVDIQMIDKEIGEIIDPIKPVDPDDPQPGEIFPPGNGIVALTEVPSDYKLETELDSGATYKITSKNERDQISVVNTNSTQAWQVWAGAELTADNVSELTLDEFYINETPVNGTGFDRLIFKSTDAGAEGVGQKDKDVTSIGIHFSDPRFQLEENSTVNIIINYKLVNWEIPD